MNPAGSRGELSELPAPARFLRNFPSTTLSFADLYQSFKQSTAFHAFVTTCHFRTMQQLVSSSDLHELLCASVAHGLQLFTAACEALPVAELEKQDPHCLVVLSELLHSTAFLHVYCVRDLQDGGDRTKLQAVTEMLNTLEAHGEFVCFATWTTRLTWC
jgi:hypothetical protein